MPEFTLLERPWGNIAFHNGVEEGENTVVTVLVAGTSFRGDLKKIMQAAKDANSEEQFVELCRERGISR